MLVFNDVMTVVLEEESRRKNKEDKISSSQQTDALIISRGRLAECGSSGSHKQNRSKSQCKKKINVINVESNDT